MSDYDDLLDDDEDDKPEPKAKDNAAFAQMRKELKDLKKEADELRAFREEREKADRALAISEVFKEVGLNPKHAKFYQGDEATPDAIKAWAVAEDFLQVNEDEAPAPAPEQRGFTPTVINEGQALGTKVYTFEEYEELRKSDPQRAQKAREANRVQRETAPGGSVLFGRDR